MKDQNGNVLIGYVLIGDMAIHRTKLVEGLPDFDRFMRCLDDAQALDADMHGDAGRVPAYVESWSADYMDDVAATMDEISELHRHAAAELVTHKAIREAASH